MRPQHGVVPHDILQARLEIGTKKQHHRHHQQERHKRQHSRTSLTAERRRRKPHDPGNHTKQHHAQHSETDGAQVHAVEIARSGGKVERRSPEARVLVLILLEALVRERRQQIERESRQNRPQQEDLVRLGILAGEGEAQTPVAGIGHAEAQRPHQQPRKHQPDRRQQQQRQHRRHPPRQVERQRQHKDDRPALENSGRAAVVVEARPAQPGVAIEILQRAHLGPCRVEAQRDDGQQQVDDPDAEVFRAAAAETHPQRLRDGRSRGAAQYGLTRDVVHLMTFPF